MIPGLFWMLASYGIVMAVPVDVMVHQFMASGEVSPVYLGVADRNVGWLKVMVPLTGMTAVLACFGSAMLACSRMLYALARDGFAPRRLARIHPRTRIPWNAQLLVLGLVAVVPVGLGIRTLLELPFKQGSSIVWTGMVWEVLGLGWTAVAWLRRPARQQRQPLTAGGD